jgi:AraC family transcriptional regulator
MSACAGGSARPAQTGSSQLIAPNGSTRMRGERGEAARPVLAPWQVSLATGVMRRNIGSAVSIAEISGLCRLSISYFVRAFTNTVGIAPYAWFVRQRIFQAEHLLANTALPLAQVALECGFSDQAHFTKAFAKLTGLTPARWRQQRLSARLVGMAEGAERLCSQPSLFPSRCRSAARRSA